MSIDSTYEHARNIDCTIDEACVALRCASKTAQAVADRKAKPEELALAKEKVAVAIDKLSLIIADEN